MKIALFCGPLVLTITLATGTATALASNDLPAVMHFRSAPTFGSVETSATCNSHDGSAGVWAAIEDSGVLVHEGYIAHNDPALAPTVVVCNDRAGGPGVIAGTIPKGSVLAPGSRVDYYPMANIEYRTISEGKSMQNIWSIPLDRNTVVRQTPKGIIAVPNANLLEIFPQGSALQIGGSSGARFWHADTPAQPAITRLGCSIVYKTPGKPNDTFQAHGDCYSVLKKTSMDDLFAHNLKP